jgi:hypothetical protein
MAPNQTGRERASKGRERHEISEMIRNKRYSGRKKKVWKKGTRHILKLVEKLTVTDNLKK